MVPEIYDIIQALDSMEVDTTVSTNGLMLDELTVMRLAESGLSNLQVSIDYPISDLHDKSRNKKGLFERAIEGLSLARKFWLRCTINFVVTKNSLPYIEGMNELAEDMDIGLVLSEFKPVGRGAEMLHEIISHEDFYKLRNSKYVSLAPFFLDSITTGRQYCSIGLDRLYIDEIGDIYPCDLYRPYKKLGNIMADDISDIWLNSSVLNDFREFKYGKSMPHKNTKCGLCGIFSHCRSGCLALAELHGGHAYSGDPRCAK